MESSPADLPPPELVQEQSRLDALVRELGGHDEIAFDTEADSFFSYHEKVCLIQVTAGERDYLVDPLAGLDLAGLGEVLADPQRTVVFHDGEYDILILKRDFGFSFAGLFDTRVAAAALGIANPGLASVIEDNFGVELDKSMQRSNWSARPLTAKQIDYARLDTHFLVPLMHRMRAELERRGRTHIVAGECGRLELLEPAQARFDADDFVRIKGVRNLGPQERRNLRELFALREQIAERADVPPFKAFTNQTLLNLARVQARKLADLRDVHGFSPRQLKRHGERVLETLRRARELGPLERLPRPPRRDGAARLSEAQVELHDDLKQWRKGRAQRDGIDASLILNRHVLLRLAVAQPRTPAELAAVEGMLPWQVETLGEEILATIDRRLERGSPKAPSGRSRRRRSRG